MRTKMVEGKVYIPAEIRRKVSAKEFLIFLDGENIILKPVKKNIEKYYGILKRKRHISPEE